MSEKSEKSEFQFQPEHDGSLSLESAVFQALGYASTCWDVMYGVGKFHSTEAKDCGEKLLAFIRGSGAVVPGSATFPVEEDDVWTPTFPDSMTPEEKVAFREKWDAAVDAGRRSNT